jgi:regulator of nucleoside diphosphate kinase
MSGTVMLLSNVDAENLTDLLERLKQSRFPDRNQIDVLEQTLEGAEVLSPASIPPNVVSIDGAVRIVDLQTGKKKTYTLVLPDFADMAKGFLSVIAPLGIALLGCRQGEVVEVQVPGGMRLLRIERVRKSERLTARAAAAPSACVSTNCLSKYCT